MSYRPWRTADMRHVGSETPGRTALGPIRSRGVRASVLSFALYPSAVIAAGGRSPQPFDFTQGWPEPSRRGTLRLHAARREHSRRRAFDCAQGGLTRTVTLAIPPGVNVSRLEGPSNRHARSVAIRRRVQLPSDPGRARDLNRLAG